MGSLAYNPDMVMMVNYNGNAMYTELEAKVMVGRY